MNTLSYKTVSANKNTVNKEWVLVDADGQTLGRLASKVAMLIRGKYKPSFTPHVDCGDNVVVINADDAEHAVTVPGASGLTLHALLADATDADPVVQGATAAGETLTVPGRTAAVFEQLQAGAQGAGLPCNTR